MSVRLDGNDNLSRTGNNNQNDNVEINKSTNFFFNNFNDFPKFLNNLEKIINKFEKITSYYKIYNIPIINFCIMLIFSILLIRLTFHYHRLYTYSSIIATIATNLVLYGIADTLAQSITAYFTGVKVKLQQEEALNNHRPRTQSIVTKYIHNLTNTRYNNNSSYRFQSDDNIGLDDTNTNGHDGLQDTNAQDFFLDYGDNGDQGSINSSYDLSSSVSSLPPAIRPSQHRLSLANRSALSWGHAAGEVTFQVRRFVGFMLWGFLMAFVQVAWYSFLNSMYTDVPTFVRVLERVLTDQLCFSPVSLLCFFTYGTIVMENGSREDVRAKIYRIYLSTLACNFCLWFPVQFVNFLVMPTQFQVPFSSAVGVLWNCFLSLRNAATP